MRALLSAAGRSFLRAFVASIIVLAPGILSAPDLNQTKVLGVAALIASISAGLKTLQIFVPQLQFPGRYGEIIASFVRAAVAAFLTSVIGILDAPDLNVTRAVVTAVLVGAITAGIRAIQGYFTLGDNPVPQKGFAVAD